MNTKTLKSSLPFLLTHPSSSSISEVKEVVFVEMERCLNLEQTQIQANCGLFNPLKPFLMISSSSLLAIQAQKENYPNYPSHCLILMCYTFEPILWEWERQIRKTKLSWVLKEYLFYSVETFIFPQWRMVMILVSFWVWVNNAVQPFHLK